MTGASELYRKHYGGGVPVGATSLDVYAQLMFGPGQRYQLVSQAFAKRKPRGGVLVEIGCGGGEALLILSKQFNFDRVVGIDIAIEGIHEQIEFHNANLDEKWPFQDGEVDFLIGMMIIEHLYDPFHSFGEIKRILSKSGEAFINLPLVTSLRNRYRVITGSIPVTSIPYKGWFQQSIWDGNHLHYFSVKSIRDLAKATGLNASDFRGVGKFYQIKTTWPGLFASEVTFRITHQ
jgi:cyclopropane fatty-acyl-phospholipid synthase-like methyltransferase